MEDKKNEIIIKEIKFWQKTKLIPDQYCLFLLRFYLKDEKEGPKLPKRLLFLMFWFFTFMMIISVSFFAFHFTQFSLSVQIAIFSLYALYFFSLALFFRYRVELLTTIFSVLFSSFICCSVIILYVLHRWDMSLS